MHGQILYKDIKAATDRPVYFIYGGVPGEEREEIRQIVQKETNAILIGSYGTVSTGINWPSLRYVIAASPYKSRIKVLQSIGRGLRKDTEKMHCTWYDIADDLSFGEKQNITLQHYIDDPHL
jgi:superfamily II DNA or RNA helicase